MCLILHLDGRSDPLDHDEIRDFYRRNSDGFGAMWRTQAGELRRIVSLPGDARAAIVDYTTAAQAAHDDGATDLVCHWRMRTSGPTTLDQCHPWELPRSGAIVAHNGVFGGLGDDARSDTQWMLPRIDAILASSETADPWDDPSVRYVMDAIAQGSVLAFATPHGVRWHGRQGVWHRGRRYSNTYAWSYPQPPSPAAPIATAATSYRDDRADRADRGGDLWDLLWADATPDVPIASGWGEIAAALARCVDADLATDLRLSHGSQRRTACRAAIADLESVMPDDRILSIVSSDRGAPPELWIVDVDPVTETDDAEWTYRD